LKNSSAVKKCAAPKKAIVKKDVKSQSGGQERAVNSKNFNSNNSDKFGVES